MPPSDTFLTNLHQQAAKNHVWAKRLADKLPVILDHSAEAAHSWLLATVIHQRASVGTFWILCEAPRQRERLAVELELWGIEAAVLPDETAEAVDGTATDPEASAERMTILQQIAAEKCPVVIAAADVFSTKAPSPKDLQGSRKTLNIGEEHDPAALATLLSDHGYERVGQVFGRGQFTIRGGILDLFPWQGASPLRLEFFDTELESIREFDIDTQISRQKCDRAELLLAEPSEEATVSQYRSKSDAVAWIGEDAPPSSLGQIALRILEGSTETEGEEDFSTACFGSPLGTFDAGDFVLQEIRRDTFFQQIEEWKREGWNTAMVFSNKGEQERFTELAGQKLDEELGLHILRGELMASFTVPSLKLAVISSSELFGRYRSPGQTRRSHLDRQRMAVARASLDEINEGDLVVHAEYGVGRFRGIQETDEQAEEISIEYKDGSLLSVPLDQAHLVGKYIGLGGKTPELQKLGSTAWKNARKAAEKSILDYAAQLLRIQAERESEPGFPHSPDSRWMWEFENSFHFTETPDQRRAIEEMKRDMESPQPMDRLVCGDVGFGKTEVAIRAAFKAATGGKQVAILVPTTVLAEQHWRTFRERMSDYPIRVELLNRFRTPSEVRSTIVGLKEGSVDIVIGTHRLISGDVIFKDLGLVVIDEEQRFGVKHKERFKELFRQVDVMSLSATPIPRTLYMALMGARDMSTIDTPPPNRTPVSTSVCAYDERIIRESIRRELKRGGQVFFLHNRVKSIEMMRRKLQDLVPEARILVGHGQMEKDELEVVMRRFVHGEADILLATTIIETGIDIPNANTILIDRADRFGLADLYQLRGRVGRAGEKAYAILLLPRDMMAAGDARKRINAIKQYTALGSGFKIAMRDLEIRGAGNLLGTKQSGHIAAIGFDLYCQLLKQSVDRLRGRPVRERVDVLVKADFLAFSETEFNRSDPNEVLPAYLPASFLPETRLRITAYRELAEAPNPKELDKIEANWRDRFGRLPVPVSNLLDVSRLKALASLSGVSAVEIKGQRLMLTRNGSAILLEGRRFPRLQSTAPAKKLAESIDLLRTL